MTSAWDQRRRIIALEAASRAVCAGLPAHAVQDPDAVARRTISVAVIFASYLEHGPADLAGPSAIPPQMCSAGVGGGEICARLEGHSGRHDPDARLVAGSRRLRT